MTLGRTNRARQPARAAMTLAVVAALLLSACGSGATTAAVSPAGPADVPDPPLAAVVPTGYRAQQVWHEPLSGGVVDDVIVTSAGPSDTASGWQSADLQVLSWDEIAGRWNVTFDAQKAIPPTDLYKPSNSNRSPGGRWGDVEPSEAGTLVDATASVSLGDVRFAELIPDAGAQLVFSVGNGYGGSGIWQNLVVVGFENGLATVAYLWSGSGLHDWTIDGERIEATADYFSPSDPACCAARTYDFALGVLPDGRLSAVGDERPWLGVLALPMDALDPDSTLTVLDVVTGSPADGVVQPGDVILRLPNARPVDRFSLIGPALFDELIGFDSGQTAEIVLRRAGIEHSIAVTLGSLIDPSADGVHASGPSDASLI